VIVEDRTKGGPASPRIVEKILSSRRTHDGRLAIELEFRDGTRDLVTMTVVEWLVLSLLPTE
jgi:hypothetical protein